MIGAVLAAVAGRKWEVGILFVLCAAALLLWHADRRSQYALGAAEAKAEYERLLLQSKVLTDQEAKAAISAASEAARKVCIEKSLPPADCEGL